MKLFIATVTTAIALATAGSAMVDTGAFTNKEAATHSLGKVTHGVQQQVAADQYLSSGRDLAQIGSETVNVSTFKSADRTLSAFEYR